MHTQQVVPINNRLNIGCSLKRSNKSPNLLQNDLRLVNTSQLFRYFFYVIFEP